MMAIMISFTVVIALFLFLVPGGHSFTTGVGTTPAIHPSLSTATQLYGKRKRIKKKIKEIIGAGGGGDGGAPEGDEATAAVADETTPMPVSEKVEVGTTTPSPSVVDTTNGSEGKKVKLSERKANQLSKKYEDIDNSIDLDLTVMGDREDDLVDFIKSNSKKKNARNKSSNSDNFENIPQVKSSPQSSTHTSDDEDEDVDEKALS